MLRNDMITKARDYVLDGQFIDELSPRIACKTESQNPDRLDELHRYLDDLIIPAFVDMGFECKKYDNPYVDGGPVLLAHLYEGEELPTLLTYGHGDVVMGLDDQWTRGAGPWVVDQDGDYFFGRGTADNKGQHTLNMAVMRMILEERGCLGFNVKFLIEMGEENGSKGLREIITANKHDFAADMFLASDGPRIQPNKPTLYLGARGAKNFDLVCKKRKSGHHSGNWGGLLSNPGIILSHAISSIVNATGEILIPGLLPPPMPNSVRDALKDIVIDPGDNAPEIDADWGQPGMTPPEKVFGWNSFDVLAMTTGNPDRPVNAVPPEARAHCQLRYFTGTDDQSILATLRKHLDDNGFSDVQITPPPACNAIDFTATRTDIEHPWVKQIAASFQKTTGAPPAVVPSLGGSICNDLFTDVLGLPVIWVPHSYAACNQHAPDEHILLSITASAAELMAGLFWDMGDARPST